MTEIESILQMKLINVLFMCAAVSAAAFHFGRLDLVEDEVGFGR